MDRQIQRKGMAIPFKIKENSKALTLKICQLYLWIKMWRYLIERCYTV
jgi:hypothetical protein